MAKKKSEIEIENAVLKRQLDAAKADAKREQDKRDWLAARTRRAYGQGIYIVIALIVVFNVDDGAILWAIIAAIVFGVVLFGTLLKDPEPPRSI